MDEPEPHMKIQSKRHFADTYRLKKSRKKKSKRRCWRGGNVTDELEMVGGCIFHRTTQMPQEIR
uniref:Uncharacterized protein n=1 Tax=Arundo donax TaxID=35708 RepID=A0A0A8XXU2_ARUDO